MRIGHPLTWRVVDCPDFGLSFPEAAALPLPILLSYVVRTDVIRRAKATAKARADKAGRRG
jgi:hypothetical protein